MAAGVHYGSWSMASDKPVIIVNLKSGGGLRDAQWAKRAARIGGELGPFDARFTERAGHARQLAAEEAAAGRRLVIACGGDGTISEVADGLLTSGAAATEMGIIPRGTGGDFRRSLDLPSDMGAAARRVRNSPARRIDAGRASFVAHDGTQAVRHFLNVASFGFSSAVASRANASSKALGGGIAFLSAVLRSVVSYDNAEVHLTLDDGERERRTVVLVAIGNGAFFGGGMNICPDARLSDNLLDCVVVGDMSAATVLTKIGRLYDGTHTSLDQVRSARVRKLHAAAVEPAQHIPLELDGETPGRLPATFEVLPGALALRF